MLYRNTENKYGFVAKLLHWLVAFAIIFQIIIAIAMEYSSSSLSARLFFIHKSMGLTLLLLAILFVCWRLFNRKPRWPLSMPTWEISAAKLVHFLLYCVILIMPLSGWLMSTAAGHPPSFWGLFSVSAPIPINHSLAAVMHNVHHSCAWILLFLIIIHTLAAFKHLLVDKDNIMQRML